MNSELGQHECDNLRVTISNYGFGSTYLLEGKCDTVYTRISLNMDDLDTEHYLRYPALAHEMMLGEHQKFPKGKNNFIAPLDKKDR